MAQTPLYGWLILSMGILMKQMALVLCLVFSWLAFSQDYNHLDYQIGNEFGKIPLESSDSVFQAAAVAKFMGGTAFYLGEHQGKHIMATNYHVLPSALNCISLNTLRFQVGDQYYFCDKFIASFPEIELSLFTIKASGGEEVHISAALEFSKEWEPQMNEELFLLGYGPTEDQYNRVLHISKDEDCRIFHEVAQFIHDPDTLHPASYQVWSLPIGCDATPGDSGSPVFSSTGDLIGIFWTGGTPKIEEAKSSYFIEWWRVWEREELWSELSYFVPVTKIREFLLDEIEKGSAHSDLFISLL